MLRVLLTLAAGLLLALLVSSCGKETVSTTPLGVPPPPSEFVFNGPADGLKGTEVVFSADSPLAPDKSAIWCSTVVMAWQEAKERLQSDKLALQGNRELSERLNSAPSAKKMLPEEWYYVGFGETPDPGLPERLKAELKMKFPDACEIDLPGDPKMPGFFSVAYLRGGSVFDPPFTENPQELSFPALDGKPTSVECFGICGKSAYGLWEHVRVLESNLGGPVLVEDYVPRMVLDLASDNPRLEVVLAQLEPAESLEATWRKAEELALNWNRRKMKEYYLLGPNDSLTVPVVAFRLQKLLTDSIEGTGRPDWDGYPYFLSQQINFSLTASGALVESSGGCCVGCAPRDFTFDQPFLIAMKLRKAEEPFFLMWVANAELMRKR